MIRIQVRRQADGMELRARGNAGYAPQGQDIVCAGVSALLYGFLSHLNSLSPIATEADGPHVEIREGEGDLWVRTHGLGGQDQSAWQVTEAGLWLIAAAYPAHVAIESGDTAPQKGKGAEYGSK